MKNKLTKQPIKNIIYSSHNLFWLILYMLPSSIISMLIGIINSGVVKLFNYHKYLYLIFAIFCYLLWFSWFIYVLLNAYGSLLESKQIINKKLKAIKGLIIFECVILNMILPITLIGNINWITISIISLIQISISIFTYHCQIK